MASEGRKVGSLKRRVRSHLARREMKNCTPLWREAHYFQVKMCKTHHARATCGSCDVEKVHAVVARSTFPSQNVQNTLASDHFWKLRCRKSARGCGAKHISKSKCTTHTRSGPPLGVQMSKKCTLVWREAHVEVKMYNTHRVRTTFGGSDVEKVHGVVARSTFRSQNVKNTRGSDHSWKFRCRFAWQAQGIVHLVKSEQNVRVLYHFQIQPPLHHTLQYITLHYNYNCNYNYTFTTFYYTTLHYTTLHSIAFNYTTLHYTTLHYPTLHYTTLHYTTLPSTTLQHITLHSTTLQLHNYTTTQLHSTTLHYAKLHSTTLNYTTLHYVTLHYTPLHYTTSHYTTTLLTLHDTTFHNTPRHYTTPHYTTRHHLPLHFTTLHYTTLHNTATTTTQLHSTTLHYTKLHYITLHYTPLGYATLHYTTLHDLPLHSTTLQLQLQLQLHYTTLHYTKLHYTTTLLSLHDTTFYNTPRHYTTLHYATLHYTE